MRNTRNQTAEKDKLRGKKMRERHEGEAEKAKMKGQETKKEWKRKKRNLEEGRRQKAMRKDKRRQRGRVREGEILLRRKLRIKISRKEGKEEVEEADLK